MATLEDYFSFQVFLIVLRETLELAIIISVLLAFLHQSFIPSKEADEHKQQDDEETERLITSEDFQVPDHHPQDQPQNQPESVPPNKSEVYDTYKYLRVQVWVGGLLGLLCCLIIGTVILSVFYVIGNDLWSVTEHYWEGTFSIIASLIISFMGIKILRVNKMQAKWKAKLTHLIKKSNYLKKATAYRTNNRTSNSLQERVENFTEKYSMLLLPFVTTLREGMEAIVFIGGIGINENTSIPAIIVSTLTAVIIGSIVGILLYGTGNKLSLQWFLVTSTGFLYLIAAGLFSKGVWNFELQKFIDLCDGFDVSETGHGPGSYDIANSIWHVNCCNGELQDDGAFWMIVTAIFGWTNSATYGSVISYICYWCLMITVFTSLSYEEHNGVLPLVPVKLQLRRIRKRLRASTLELNASRESIDSMTPLDP